MRILSATVTLIFWIWPNGLISQIALPQPGYQTQSGNTQSADTTEKKPVVKSDPRAYKYAEWQLAVDTNYKWDSSFGLIHRYNKRFANGRPFVDLGANGSPSMELTPLIFRETGFQTGLDIYALQNTNPGQMKFYDAKVPFSSIRYVQGPNGVFLINALHSHSFSPRWNFTVQYNSVQNLELYLRSNQNHVHRGTILGNKFASKNLRYENIVIFSWNRAKRNENWGIKTDSIFYVPTDQKVRYTEFYESSNNTASSFYATHHHLIDHRFFLSDKRTIFISHIFLFLFEIYAK